MADDRSGLQAERTALSWLRTALAALALAAVSVKAALSTHDVAPAVSAGLAALAAATLYAGGLMRSTPNRARPRMVLLAAAVSLAAVAATVAAVVHDLLTRR